jgi:hypothetical protein
MALLAMAALGRGREPKQMAPYNQRLVDAKAEGRTLDVRDEYLEHMVAAAASYDTKGRAKTGRAVKHVLLLHMNDLNAL